MSFSALSYDPCAYKQNVKESISTGEYMLNRPKNDCKPCFHPSPNVHIDKSIASYCENTPFIDVDSELIGLNVKASKCKAPYPKPCALYEIPECQENFMSAEDTKLSNPPCTLRGTGWNRWEWLCENPQSKYTPAFQTNINDRIVAKDNHRPLKPLPIDQTIALPKNCHSDHIDTHLSYVKKYKYDDVPFMHWRCCGEIEKY